MVKALWSWICAQLMGQRHVMPFQRCSIEIGTQLPMVSTLPPLLTAVYFDSSVHAPPKHFKCLAQGLWCHWKLTYCTGGKTRETKVYFQILPRSRCLCTIVLSRVRKGQQWVASRYWAVTGGAVPWIRTMAINKNTIKLFKCDIQGLGQILSQEYPDYLPSIK